MTPLAVSALPTLGPAALTAPRSSTQPGFPLDRLAGGRARLYYLARAGIYHGTRALGLGPGDVVLMPAYHHGVEVAAIRATGTTVVFYAIDRRFRANLDEIRVLARQPRVRAIYLTHVAGFAQPAEEARALADQLGLWLIEDCALALFSRHPDGRPLGSNGDLAVFCLYKSLPVPHGGLALARVPLRALPPPPWSGTWHHVGGSLLTHAELHGGWPGRLAHRLARSTSRRALDRVICFPQVGTSDLRAGDLRLGASRLVRWLLHHADETAIAERRRANYRRLLDALGSDRSVPTGDLPVGTVPLFLPLAVADRRRALADLARRGIEAIDFWRTGDVACPLDRFSDAAWLRRHVIEIPIHQGLDDETINGLACAVKDVLAHA